MVQVLPRPVDIGEMFGAGVGQGFSQGMETLQQELQQTRENKEMESIAAKWGDTTSPMEMLKDIQKAPVGQDTKKLYMSGLQMMMKQQDAQRKQQQQESLFDMLGLSGGQPPAPGMPQGQQIPGEMPGEMPMQQPQQQPAPQGIPSPVPDEAAVNPAESFTDQQIAAATAMNPNLGRLLQSQKDAAVKERRETEKISKKEIADSYKATQAYRSDIIKKYKAAKSDEMIFDRMEKLNEGKDSKELISATTAKLAEYFGIPISVIGNPESEEFDKLTIALTKNIKESYGARITVTELMTFIKSLPSLKNSTEGRERLVEGLKLLDAPKKLEYEVYQDIRKENKGGPLPFDLQEQVTERMEGKLDELAERFKNIASGGTGEQAQQTSFDKLPSPSGYSGKIMRNPDTGKRYQSNGKSWKEI